MRQCIRLWMVACMACMAAVVQGCKDDDAYSLGDIARDWVTVRVEGEGMYSFIGDSWGTLWPAATSVWGYAPVEGERAILYFNPLESPFGNYDMAIKAEQIQPILTKPVEVLRLGEEDQFGDDPAYINEAWISGGYLNMIFTQKMPVEQAHRVSLIQKETADAEDDGYVHLEFRYNTYGDTLDIAHPAAVCYNLNTLDLAGSEGIKLRIHSAVNGERILTFAKTAEATPDIAKSIDVSSMKAR